MIRINLLGDTPRAKRGKRSPAISMGGGEGSNLVAVALVVAALTIGGNLYMWQYLTRQKQEIATQMQAADAESRRLAVVKARVEEAEKQESAYRRRVDVIDSLRSKQSGPVELLAAISNTVNSTDAVWLVSMKEDGTKINIEGAALSMNAVANLMDNLKRSGYFKNVEIKESYQDEQVRDMQSFTFLLICEKLTKS